MKRSINIVLLLCLLLTGTVMAQERDRRTDLNVSCYTNFCVSSTGTLWLSTACGMIYTADGIHSTWRTLTNTDENRLIHASHFECMAAFGNSTVLAAGFLHGRKDYDFVYRTTSGGVWWDTVVIDPHLNWVHACCYRPDGRVWLGSASGRSNGVLAYSVDSGRTFQVLRTEFDGTTGIHTLHMFDADSGYMGGYYNNLFSTADNWRTVHRIPTPMDQKLVVEHNYMDTWINRIRQWGDYLIVTESKKTFYTSLKDKIEWRKPPVDLNSYEVDNQTGSLWAVSDGGLLVRLTDWNSVNRYDVRVNSIFGIVDGNVYCESSAGVLRVSPDGKVDTCGFYTTEHPIEEPEITLKHGQHLWGTDGSSVFILDDKGWYRVAQPLDISKLNSHPDRYDCIVILRDDGKNYTVDTAGAVEPYVIKQPLGPFVKSGLKKVEITTYAGGCFHFIPQTLRYSCQGNMLTESYNDVEKQKHLKRQLPVSDVEQALLRLGERYSIFPTPQDFGLEDTTVDLHAVYQKDDYWCTSRLGYRLTFINNAGDTLFIYGSVDDGNDIGGNTRFPWLLPMQVKASNADFISYQPCLWQTLRTLMPDTMLLADQLDNSTLHQRFTLQSGDLLFFTGVIGDMDKAITESTGVYTHVAMVERDSSERVWIIDASPYRGVRRTLLSEYYRHYYDLYRFIVPFDTAAVIARVHTFLGQPYDDCFLPDNGKMYCSELIYECFLDTNGNHLFKAKPMNWRDAKGKLPKYWKKHFQKLGMKAPEGVLGTNPTDLSRSPLLRKL